MQVDAVGTRPRERRGSNAVCVGIFIRREGESPRVTDDRLTPLDESTRWQPNSERIRLELSIIETARLVRDPCVLREFRNARTRDTAEWYAAVTHFVSFCKRIYAHWKIFYFNGLRVTRYDAERSLRGRLGWWMYSYMHMANRIILAMYFYRVLSRDNIILSRKASLY